MTKCQTCGHTMHANFCQTCGEKKFDRHELSLKHFFSDALESILHFDNKFLRSLKTLLVKPGQLAVEFTEGRRVRLMKPLQLFLVINLIFFFILPANQFALRLYNYLHFRPFINYHTQEMVNEKIEAGHITFGEFQKVFDQKMQTESKEFVFVYIIVYGLLFALLFVRKRRQLSEHLVFATNFMSFYLVYSILNYYLIGLPYYTFISKTNYSETFDTVTSGLAQLVVFVYLFIGFNRFYQGSKIWSFVSAGTIAASFFFLLQFYRMFMFLKIVKYD